MAKKTEKSKKTDRKKVKLKVKSPSQVFRLKYFFPHLLTALSLLPILIALWLAVPDLTIDIGDKSIDISNVLTKYETETDRFGFREAYDLQKGVNIKYTLNIPEKTENNDDTNITVTGTTSTGSTSSGDVSLGERKEITDENADIEETFRLFQERLNTTDLADKRIQIIKLDEDSYELVIDISGSREDLGTALPTLLSLSGDISVWVDDPEYTSSGTTSQFNLGFLEGKIQTDVNSDEVIKADVVNDIQTNGVGLRVTFSPSAIGKLVQASQSIGQSEQPNGNGFVIVVDGIPIAIQSLYASGSTDSMYFLPLNQDENVIRLMATIINQDTLPMNLDFATSNNNVTYPPTGVDISLFKIVLIVGFTIFNGILIYRYKSKSIPLILLNVGSILLAIGFHKIYKSYFTFELLLGLFGGLVVINYLVSTYYKDLIEANAVKNIGKIKDILSQIRKNSISFLFFPFLFVILIISTFSTQSVSQIISGIGIVYISSIIIIWTTFTAFVNEVFLLPILYERKD